MKREDKVVKVIYECLDGSPVMARIELDDPSLTKEELKSLIKLLKSVYKGMV